MKARVIVVSAAAAAWLPALILSVFAGPFALILPVMGFYAIFESYGRSGHSEASMQVWGTIFLLLFTSLGIYAVAKKSIPVAMLFAGLLLMSVVLLLVHVYEAFLHDPKAYF